MKCVEKGTLKKYSDYQEDINGSNRPELNLQFLVVFPQEVGWLAGWLVSCLPAETSVHRGSGHTTNTDERGLTCLN